MFNSTIGLSSPISVFPGCGCPYFPSPTYPNFPDSTMSNYKEGEINSLKIMEPFLHNDQDKQSVAAVIKLLQDQPLGFGNSSGGFPGFGPVGPMTSDYKEGEINSLEIMEPFLHDEQDKQSVAAVIKLLQDQPSGCGNPFGRFPGFGFSQYDGGFGNSGFGNSYASLL